MARHLAVLASPDVLRDPQVEARAHFQRLATCISSAQRPLATSALPFVPARIKTSKPTPMQQLAASTFLAAGMVSPKLGSPRVGARKAGGKGEDTPMTGSAGGGASRAAVQWGNSGFALGGHDDKPVQQAMDVATTPAVVRRLDEAAPHSYLEAS